MVARLVALPEFKLCYIGQNQIRAAVLENLFPTRLKQLRKEKQMTQQKLSILLGVHINSIKRWETGKRFPGPGEIQALAQALGVRIKDLFDFPEHPTL